MLNSRPAGYYQMFDSPKFHGHYKGMGDVATIPTPPNLTGSEWNPFSSLTDPNSVLAVLASDNPPTSVPWTSGNAPYIIKDWLTNPWVLGGAALVAILLLKGRR